MRVEGRDDRISFKRFNGVGFVGGLRIFAGKPALIVPETKKLISLAAAAGLRRVGKVLYSEAILVPLKLCQTRRDIGFAWGTRQCWFNRLVRRRLRPDLRKAGFSGAGAGRHGR